MKERMKGIEIMRKHNYLNVLYAYIYLTYVDIHFLTIYFDPFLRYIIKNFKCKNYIKNAINTQFKFAG